MPGEWIIWGSTLSPFHLKLERMCAHAGLPVRVLPGPRSRLENLRYMRRRRRLIAGQLPLTWPRLSPLDEFPQVPFLFGPDGENLYDSSAIAEWLDTQAPAPRPRSRLIPHDDAAAAFLVHLIDDYFDEWVLYLIHHQRWKVSARDTRAHRIVAREFNTAPFEPVMAAWFRRRQIRRLPYLFSVAPTGFRLDGLAAAHQPPSRTGFPPTHELLEDAFDRLLAALETVFAARPFLLGRRFTLADASVYGELGVLRLADPTTNATMRRAAPRLHSWLECVHDGAFGDGSDECWQPDEILQPLLAEIARTYIPLMRQNALAYERLRTAGETLFNEFGFWRGRGLYEGTIDGHPFRSVAKTFQVKSWRALQAHWHSLDPAGKARIEGLLPSASAAFGQTER